MQNLNSCILTRNLALLAVLFLAGTGITMAQSTIAFDTPNQITDSSVSTLGTLDYAYSLYYVPVGGGNTASNTVTVNTVPFVQANYSSTDFSDSFDAGYFGYDGNSDTSDLEPLLTNGSYVNNADPITSLTLNGLTSGQTYQVELFVNDTRSYGAGRYETFSTSSTLALDNSGQVDFQSASGDNGDEVIGTFIATGTSPITSETIYFQGGTTLSGGTPDDQINAFQVRDVTGLVGVVPEPSTVASLLLGGLVVLGVFGRRLLAKRA